MRTKLSGKKVFQKKVPNPPKLAKIVYFWEFFWALNLVDCQKRPNEGSRKSAPPQTTHLEIPPSPVQGLLILESSFFSFYDYIPR